MNQPPAVGAGSLLRTFLAIVVGSLSAFALVVLIEVVGHMLFPTTGKVSPTMPVEMPLAALLSVLVAWTAGTFAGGVIAALIARTRPRVYAGLVGAIILVLTIANLTLIPHPTWFAIAGVALIVVAAGLAGDAAARRLARRTARG